MKTKSTIDKVKYFKDRTNYYFFEVFKLYDWELTIRNQLKESARASSYWHSIDDGANMATICYSLEWINQKNLTNDEIDKVAFHEVMEVLLSELQELSELDNVKPRELTSATHRVIRRFENIIYPLIKDKEKIKRGTLC